MPSFRVISAIAVAMAVTLACATSILSYLAAVSAASLKCAGQDFLGGYRIGTSDLLALPLLSWCVAAMIEKARRNPKTTGLLESFDMTVLELGWFRVTYGMLLVYSVLFGFVAGNASMTEFSGKRYMAISTYCQSNDSLSLGLELR
jgi:hypothetical protein